MNDPGTITSFVASLTSANYHTNMANYYTTRALIEKISDLEAITSKGI